MARQKKPTYEFVASRNEYRKRIKGPDGKCVALYAKTPEELAQKVAVAQQEIEQDIYHRENPTVEEYAQKWLTMHGSPIRTTTLVDCLKAHKEKSTSDFVIANRDGGSRARQDHAGHLHTPDLQPAKGSDLKGQPSICTQSEMKFSSQSLNHSLVC